MEPYYLNRIAQGMRYMLQEISLYHEGFLKFYRYTHKAFFENRHEALNYLTKRKCRAFKRYRLESRTKMREDWIKAKNES